MSDQKNSGNGIIKEGQSIPNLKHFPSTNSEKGQPIPSLQDFGNSQQGQQPTTNQDTGNTQNSSDSGQKE